MPTTSRPPLLTPRDLDILLALDHCPLTALQLLKLSQTFARPFTAERRVRERLLVLCLAGRARRWQYATAGTGAPGYYTLTPLGFQLLHGDEARPPTRRYFAPVGLSHQHHTHALADFVVHTQVGAHAAEISFSNFYRENTLRLKIGEEALFPDCAFRLLLRVGPPLAFLVEIDNATERVRSDKDLDSWQRKIRLYEALQDRASERFRVLVVTTRSPERLRHILATARELAHNPHRSLLYGIHLPHYLKHPNPLTAPCFLDHRGRSVALVHQRSPEKERMPQAMEPVLVSAAPVV